MDKICPRTLSATCRHKGGNSGHTAGSELTHFANIRRGPSRKSVIVRNVRAMCKIPCIKYIVLRE